MMREQVPVAETNNLRLSAMGMVNALGSEQTEILRGLLSASSAGLTPSQTLIPGREVFVGAVSEEALHTVTPLPPSLAHYHSRNLALALVALQPLREQVAEAVNRFGAHRIGVVVASSTSGIRESEAAIRHLHQRGTLTAGYSYLQQEIGSVSEALTLELGITGPAYTVSTACSASAKVFQSGRLLLERGLCDAVLVGGVDSLCRLTLNGFGALELISPARTNPFSKNRQGITIGEGACFFLLTKEGGGVQLLGVGESSDAYHMSSPDPEGTGAVAAMNRALTAAKRTPEQITVVNLHGTGTLHNDAMEAKAVSTVFPEQPWMSGTKPLTGHLLGASGATEVGLCWLLLDEYLRTGVLPLPEHPFDGEFDSLLPPLRLTPRGGINLTPTSPTCMSTSFGFGGTNCVVVIGV